MNKREALKRLREERKFETTGDTPAEEYSKLAAEALKKDSSPINAQNTEKEEKIESEANHDVIKGINTKEESISSISKSESKPDPEPAPAPEKALVTEKSDEETASAETMINQPEVNPVESDPSKNDSPDSVLPQINESNPHAHQALDSGLMEENTDSTPEAEISADTVPAETLDTADTASSTGNTKEAESNETSSKTTVFRKTKANYKAIAQAGGKRISVSLKTENNVWMRRTAMRCGFSIQEYINVLVEEAWLREKRSPYVFKDTDPLPERIPSSKTVLVAIKLTEENINRSKRLRAAHCMTMTSYMNYLIQEEMKREEKYGMRAPIFDEDDF